MRPCVSIQNLVFRWPGAAAPLLSIPNFTLQAGERVMLRGPSGSGKSTLLSLLAGIEQPQQGSIAILEHHLGELSQAQRDRVRADHIGYIFQQFNLLPYLSAVDNVTLACQFSKVRRERVRANNETVLQAAQRLLTALGLTPEQAQAPARNLSVGQQQRVAAARALLGQPTLIIADEPTSALDAERRDDFLALLFNECAQQNTALLFVTHDAGLAQHFPRHVELAELNQASAQPEVTTNA